MSACRSCDARIIWAKTEAGRPMPLDHTPSPTGTVILLPVGGGRRVARVLAGEELEEYRTANKTLFVTHWATCPDAKEWKAKPSTR